MITTSDVMVGDWVRITIEGEQYPAVVNSIKLNTEEIGVSFLAAPGDWEDGDGYDEIEPIPLTDEILKANNFILSKGKPLIEEIGCAIIYGKYERLDEDRMLNYGDSMWPIRYVHELQHALRLCGIEKEIVIKKEWL